MTDKIVRVGTVDYPVAKKMVHGSVDVIELSGTYSVPVKAATARKWRKEAGERCAFSIQAPKHLVEPPKEGTPLPGNLTEYGGFKLSEENLKLWKNFFRVKDVLKADTVVILTPASFTPTKANLDAFGAFLKAIRERDSLEHLQIAWEPKGPWELEHAAVFAERNEITLAVDPLRDEPPAGKSTYFRLGPFAAMGSRMGLYDLERIKEAAAPFEKVTCVFHTNRALDDARNLKKILD